MNILDQTCEFCSATVGIGVYRAHIEWHERLNEVITQIGAAVDELNARGFDLPGK